MRRLFFMLFSLFLLLLPLISPAETTQTDTLHSVQQRSFNKEEIQKYKQDPNFDYEEKKKETDNTQVATEETAPLFSEETMNWLVQLIVYLSVGITVFVFLTKLFKGGITNWLTPPKKEEKSKVVFSEEAEADIHKIPFERMLREAVAQQKYRRAVRLLYLNSLKNLSDRELIVWRQDKTNDDYLKELKSSPLLVPFSKITHLFDYIWYGNFSIDQEHYAQIEQDFRQFNQSL